MGTVEDTVRPISISWIVHLRQPIRCELVFASEEKMAALTGRGAGPLLKLPNASCLLASQSYSTEVPFLST
jgi:hypothetical protein